MVKKISSSEEMKRLRGAETQKEWAEKLGLQQNTVSAIEVGRIEPSAETWIKVGNVVPYPDDMRCYERAQVGLPKILSIAEEVWKERSAAPTANETVSIPIVRFTGRKFEGTGKLFPLSGSRLPHTLLAECLEVDDASANQTLAAGELVVFDKSETGSRLLRDFWGQTVLVKFNATYGHIARDRHALCIGNLRCEREGPPLEELAMGQRLNYYAFLSWHTDPVVSEHARIIVGSWYTPIGDIPRESLKDFEAKARQMAIDTMERFQYCAILGRVRAYYPAIQG